MKRGPASLKAPAARRPALLAWRFVDGKRGHENQSLALLEALNRELDIEYRDIEVGSGRAMLTALGLRASGRSTQSPCLLVGAGHATHLAVLAAGLRLRARTVLLMRPSLPMGLFDLCLVPEHDRVPERAGVIVTRGMLNRVRPARAREHGLGLVLLGGPSRHHRWQGQEVAACVERIARRERAVHWQVATTRRTPPETLERIARLTARNVELVRFDAVDGDWLPAQLGRAGQAWVSADSASMIYECLSGGAPTGVLELPPAGPYPDRVTRGIARLFQQGWVTPYSRWLEGAGLVPPPRVLDEATRCARWIAGHWLNPGA